MQLDRPALGRVGIDIAAMGEAGRVSEGAHEGKAVTLGDLSHGGTAAEDENRRGKGAGRPG